MEVVVGGIEGVVGEGSVVGIVEVVEAVEETGEDAVVVEDVEVVAGEAVHLGDLHSSRAVLTSRGSARRSKFSWRACQ